MQNISLLNNDEDFYNVWLQLEQKGLIVDCFKFFILNILYFYMN